MTRALPRRRRGGRPGFSMPELLVVIVLAALLILALQQALIGQRRFYDARHAASERHETVRFAMAVLGSALREANLTTGDADILGAGRIRVRVPLGLAVVCGTDASGQRVGAVALEGRWVAAAGDSVLVRRAAGWSAHALVAVDPASAQVPCVAGGGAILRLDVQVPDAVAGSPARSFRSHVFEVGSDGTTDWLYRTDGAAREVLAGPLDGPQGFAVWYEDVGGVQVPTPAGAERVGARVVARASASPTLANPRADTLVMTFGGRNR